MRRISLTVAIVTGLLSSQTHLYEVSVVLGTQIKENF